MSAILENFKNFIHPNKNENLLIIELVILAILFYYDFLFNFGKDSLVLIVLILFIIIYSLGAVSYYAYERKMAIQYTSENRFFLIIQTFSTFILGMAISIIYLLLGIIELTALIIIPIPLIFLALIFLIQRISLIQAERFLKKYVIQDENVWDMLEDETKNDFKQAESNIRSDNIPNAIINITKGLERELKIAIFHPFKKEIQNNLSFHDVLKINMPFPANGSDPRERTYYNFKNFLQNKRHLTLGNMPFILLNISDKKIGEYTSLFTVFREFLTNRFGSKYENVIEISKILFNHNFFTVEGIKLSDLRNEAAHPQRHYLGGNSAKKQRSDEILSIDNYVALLKVLAVKPNLLKLIIDLKT